MDYRFPIALPVKYALANDFRTLVEQMDDCKVINVVELKNCEILQYIIDCPKDKEDLINDMAFMTWIKNPKFQKYYLNCKSFKEIGESYIKEHTAQ